MKKILFIESELGAVNYFRIQQQREYLQSNFKDEIVIDDIAIKDLPIDNGVNYEYDAVVVHATQVCNTELSTKLIEQQKLGVKIIVDVDDYWHVPPKNPAFKPYTLNNLHNLIPAALRFADIVTTTTNDFAKVIRKYNDNVVVFPNVIDDEKIKFPKPWDGKRKLRVGFIGGSTHLEDLKLMKGVVKELEQYKDRLQFVLCGFDTKGNGIGRFNEMKSLWNEFEHIFTDDYNILEPDYLKYLLNYYKSDYPGVENQYYRRVWSKGIEEYHTLYDYVDVLVAPLVNDDFNKCKSELKIIEAGSFGKVIICSSVGSYKKFIDDFEVLAVENCRGKLEWVKNIKYLLNNPEKYMLLAYNLHKRINKEFNIHKVMNKRLQFYKNL